MRRLPGWLATRFTLVIGAALLAMLLPGSQRSAVDSAAAPLPDLVVSCLDVTSFTIADFPDGRIAYSFTITNIGGAAAVLTGPLEFPADPAVAVQALLSPDTVFGGPGDRPAGGKVLSVGPLILGAGESLSTSFEAAVPPLLPEPPPPRQLLDPVATPFLVLAVDIDNVLAEQDETNNTAATLIQLPPTGCPPPPFDEIACDSDAEIICKKVRIRDEDGDGIIEVGEPVDFFEVIEVQNPSPGDWTNTEVTDRWGAEIDVTSATPSKGTATLTTNGKSDKEFLGRSGGKNQIPGWVIGTLGPGESATLELESNTDLNPAGHQEYSECSLHEFNSGAVLKFLNPAGKQRSFETGGIVVSVLTVDLLGDCDGDGFSDAAELDAGTDPHDPLDFPATGPDPVNVINTVEIQEDGTLGPHSTRLIPSDNFSTEPRDPEPKEDEGDEAAPEPKINPLLEKMLEELGPDARVDVLVNLRDELTIPRFPDLPVGKTRDSVIGKELMARQGEIVRGLLQARMLAQAPLLRTFEELELELELQEQYWLVNAFLAEIPLGALKTMADFNEVLAIDPRFGGEEPPNDDGNADNDVADGRFRIRSDPYFDLAEFDLADGFIGLLDTGVRATHTLFSAPADHVLILADCFDGGAQCSDPTTPGFNADDDCNHGTSTAAIITGNSNLGNDFRGVTAMPLDSWKVYGDDCGLDSGAVIRGFQNGLLLFDRVLVAEIQSTQGEDGVISTAADDAFDAGAIVIAANGNKGPGAGTVRSPANAHKAIGVGAYAVQSLKTLTVQGRGPASDGRWKPDIQTPSQTETASAASDTALRQFNGTSGSTPYAAGAAALMRNWLRKFSTFDPGQTYSRLILSGQNPYCCYNNEEGAGHLEMPPLRTCGQAHWGKVSVPSTGSTINIEVSVGSGQDLEAALWWPEGADEEHDDIDIYLIDPSGKGPRTVGYSGFSVFERARVAGPLAVGEWTIRIKGYSVSSGPQDVYWTANVHGC